jgi:SulP family sulfate permease
MATAIVRKSRVPLFNTLRNYRPADFPNDLTAGLSACVVMIPSVLAYADLVHLPAVTGLYAALAAALGYSLLASSRQVIAGPDAAIGLLVGSTILPLAGADPTRMAMLAAELGLLTGILLLLAARLKLGVIADLLSRPVLVGYLNGASLILISTQLGKLFAIRTQGEEFFPLLYALVRQLPHAHMPTLLLGLSLTALLVGLARWFPTVPGALACCAAALLASLAFDLGQQGVALVGMVPSGLPGFQPPPVRWGDVAALAPAAVAIAFLAFSDGILLAQSFAEKHSQSINPNQELAALGCANLLAALWQGFPVSASQSRTAVVDAAGGRTQVAQLLAAGGLLLFLLFLTSWLSPLPRVALSAILIVTAAGMLELGSLRKLYGIDRNEFKIALTVTLVILLAGVVTGIIAGMLISMIAVLVDISRPRDAVLRRLRSDGKFHDCLQDEDAQAVAGVLVYRLYGPLVFANARHVVERIRHLVATTVPAAQWLVIDAQAITDLDVTAAQRLAELHREMAEQGIAIKIADAPRPFREELARVGLSEALGSQQFYVSVKKAVEAFEQSHPSTKFDAAQ